VYRALNSGGGHGLRWLGLAVLVGGGMAAYAVAGQLLGAFDMREVGQRVLRRRRSVAEG
jgi:hypothetical protein